VTDYVVGFPPIAGPDARVPILGAAPGVLSLSAGQYYANPRNAFWRSRTRVLDGPGDLSYETREQMRLTARIPLWDVLAEGDRPGSLDSCIVAATAVVSALAAFVAGHPHIPSVCFNGRTAQALWDRHVACRQRLPANVAFATLPSTSAANTRITFVEKTDAWQASLLGGTM